VPTRERPADRGRRLVRNNITRLLADIRRSRVAAGLSQREVARAVGVSHSSLSRLERGRVDDPSLAVLGAVCAVVGLDLALKAYPGGDPLRDRAQRALLERFRVVLHASLRFLVEQPLSIPGDLQSWDGTVVGPQWLCRVEAETAITDGQALAHRLHRKVRDDASPLVILLIADTRRNRAAMTLLAPLLGDEFRLDTRGVLGALRRGDRPAASGIVFL
jgi:transcriptional regulator with XRE-family HTH domain